MEAIIISDIHLGANNCQAKELCSFLHLIRHEIKPKQLIINGDLFDSFDSRLRKKHWSVLSELRKLSDEIDVHWIMGNHDREGPAEMVSHLFGAHFHLDHYILESGNQKVLCVHGDTWDDYISKRPILTWFADKIYGFLQTIDPSFFIAKLAKRSSKTFTRCLKMIESGAIEMRDELGCDIVITGHTHSPVARTGYYNSGSWTDRPATYLSLNDGIVSLHEFTLQT